MNATASPDPANYLVHYSYSGVNATSSFILAKGHAYIIFDNGTSGNWRYQNSGGWAPINHQYINVTQGWYSSGYLGGTQWNDIAAVYVSPMNGTGGGSGGSNTSSNQTIHNYNLSFLSSLTLNLNSYFGSNWYDLLVVYTDPWNNNTLPLDTGMYTLNLDYFDINLTSQGLFTVNSYAKNYTVNLTAFSCNQTLDTFCPVSGFPSSCNLTTLYATPACNKSSFNVTISDIYTLAVTQINPFVYAHALVNSGDSEELSMTYYFRNYENITVKFLDPALHSFINQTLSCSLLNPSNSSLNGTFNISLNCLTWTAYLDLTSLGNSFNTTIYVTASNTNNSVSDSFVLFTGDQAITHHAWDSLSNVSSVSSRITSILGIFPSISNPETAFKMGLIILFAVCVVCVLFICIPFKFNKAAVIISFSILWASSVITAIIGYTPWAYPIVPLVLLGLYIAFTVIGGKH